MIGAASYLSKILKRLIRRKQSHLDRGPETYYYTQARFFKKYRRFCCSLVPLNFYQQIVCGTVLSIFRYRNRSCVLKPSKIDPYHFPELNLGKYSRRGPPPSPPQKKIRVQHDQKASSLNLHQDISRTSRPAATLLISWHGYTDHVARRRAPFVDLP